MTGVGLRDRKKLETRLALTSAARQLAVRRGVDGFTIDEVAELANVSPRTFFNYFDSKESAIIGTDHEAIHDAGQRLRARPRWENPVAALRNVFLSDDLALVAQNWVERLELVQRYPVLLPQHLAAIDAVQTELVTAMAARLGRDSATDPFPTIVVSAWIAAFRSVMSWWRASGEPGEMRDHLEVVFELLANGLCNPKPPARSAQSARPA